MKIQSPIAWAGSKRILAAEIYKRLPKKINDYYEPFLGSGAVFLNLNKNKYNYAILNDINSALINFYNQIKLNVYEVISRTKNCDENLRKKGTTFYYEIRHLYNLKIKNKEYDIDLAAYFLFLNKHCFSEIYRVNEQNEFNQAFNNNTLKRKSCNEKNLINLSKLLLSKVELLNIDFEKACESCKADDFIYLDSPYYDTTVSYVSSKDFNSKDFYRLYNLCKRLSSIGCNIMLSSSNKEFIKNLFSKDFFIEAIPIKYSLNTLPINQTFSELIITNYKVNKPENYLF